MIIVINFCKQNEKKKIANLKRNILYIKIKGKEIKPCNLTGLNYNIPNCFHHPS